jgi:hypothetical protein
VAAVGQSSLTDTIVEIHEFLADLTSIKRLEMERDKAARLGKALANANQHVRIPMLNSRNAALAILAWTVIRIYGPMAKDVLAEMEGKPVPARVAAGAVAGTAQPATVAATSGGLVPVSSTAHTGAGAPVPASTDDAALSEWIPRVAN